MTAIQMLNEELKNSKRKEEMSPIFLERCKGLCQIDKFFPGYVVDDVDISNPNEMILILVTLGDKTGADETLKLTKGNNILICLEEDSDEVHICCSEEVTSCVNTPYGERWYTNSFSIFTIYFDWDGSEKDFREKLDKDLKEIIEENNL